MSIRRAAEEYNVPRSTLHDRVSGKVVLGSKSGPHVSILTQMKKLSWLTFCLAVLLLVILIDKKGIDAVVSASWWKSFQSRHEDLTLRQPEILSHARVVGGDD